MSRITVAEWKAFVADPDWPKEYYIEESEISVDGETLSDDRNTDTDYLGTLPQGGSVKISGCVCSDMDREINIDLRSMFRLWKRKRTHTVLAVEVSLDMADALKEAIRGAGGKVLG